MVAYNAQNTPDQTNKGDLVIGQGGGSIPGILAAGINDKAITADSTQSTGTKFAYIPSSIITKFTSSGTWTKDSRTVSVMVIGWGGGAGGGGGIVTSSGQDGTGGNGGNNGGVFYFIGPSGIFGSTETVTIGAGANGGLGSSVTTGNNGGLPTITSIGNIQTFPASQFGIAGQNGGVTASPCHSSNVTTFLTGTFGGPAPDAGLGGSSFMGVGGAAGDLTGTTSLIPTGGGGGGGRAPTVGGKGGDIKSITGVTVLAGGAANGGNGTDASTLTSGGWLCGGSGGGGGNGSATTGATSGGNGGIPGAGGGGGASQGSGTAGSGGNGGKGLLYVVEFF